MKQTKSRKLINKIIASLILAVVLFSSTGSIVMAQAPAAPPDRGPVLQESDFTEADKSEAACAALGVRIKEFFPNGSKPETEYTTVYTYASADGVTIGACQLTQKEKATGKVLLPGSGDNAMENIFRNAEQPLDQRTFEEVEAARQAEGTQAGMVSKIFGFIMSALIKILTGLVASLTNFFGYLLQLSIEKTSSLTMPPVVEDGWVLVRDFMNMFFILALITIAIATILRLDGYDWKKMLVKLILMALLINFSMAIAEVLIGFSNRLMLIIVGESDLFSYSKFMSQVVWSAGTDGSVLGCGLQCEMIQSITALILSVVMMVAFGAIAVLLIIRIVGLWFLVMVSPAAYALNILPQTKEYAKKWWHTFFKYLIWGPVAIFFLRLGNRLIEYREAKVQLTTSSEFDLLLIAGFVFGALMVAKQTGMAGATAVMSVADKSLAKAKGYGKATGTYLTARGGAFKVPAMMVGGNKFAVGRGLNKAGDFVSKATAYPMAKVKSVQNSMERENVARKKQIEKMAADMQVKGGLLTPGLRATDEDSAKQIKARHVGTVLSRGTSLEEIGNLANYGGRDVGDALMIGLKDGLLKASNPAEKEAIEKLIYKNFFTSRGIREYEYMANEDVYRNANIDIEKVGDSRKVNVNMKAINDQIKKGTPTSETVVDNSTTKIVDKSENKTVVLDKGDKFNSEVGEREDSKTRMAKLRMAAGTIPDPRNKIIQDPSDKFKGDNGKTESSADRMARLRDAAYGPKEDDKPKT